MNIEVMESGRNRKPMAAVLHVRMRFFRNQKLLKQISTFSKRKIVRRKKSSL